MAMRSGDTTALAVVGLAGLGNDGSQQAAQVLDVEVIERDDGAGAHLLEGVDREHRIVVRIREIRRHLDDLVRHDGLVPARAGEDLLDGGLWACHADFQPPPRCTMLRP